jgi:hypothetical protein
VLVPVLVGGERLVDAVVKVLVVGEDDVAADVVQLQEDVSAGLGRKARWDLRSPRV